MSQISAFQETLDGCLVEKWSQQLGELNPLTPTVAIWVQL